MFVAILALMVVLDHRSGPDPVGLVNQLGASRYALRIAAEEELAKLGRSALPALRAGKNSTDAEIRARAVALIARIENALLLQSTPVTLDFRDVPLAEAIETINRETGLLLTLSTEDRPRLARRRIDLRSEPVPFWRAIDLLSSAGQIHASPEDRPATGALAGTFLLQEGRSQGSAPISDSGPFRVRLTSIHSQSEIPFEPLTPILDGPALPTDPTSSAKPRSHREFFLQFAVEAEPRLSITRTGSVRLTSAIDDRGQSLLIPANRENIQQNSAYFGMSPSASLRFRVDLTPPDIQAKRIQSIRGMIPIVVATRKPEPLVIALPGTRGQFFRNDEAALTLLDHRPAIGNQPAMIQLAIRSFAIPDEPADPGQGEPLGYRPDSPQQQIELLDANGNALAWFPSATLFDGEETRLTLTVPSQGSTAVPATLRYHGILRAKTEVGFEFRDIPLP